MEAQPVSEKRALLKSVFGYEGFRPGQEQLIDALLQGRDAMGIMPTGAGKSMCYQLPALLLPGITLVVSPLISLMKDQVNALVQSGVRAAYLNSSLTEGQTAKAIANAMEGVYKIIYVAPERLFTPRFQNFAQGMNISMVCVDEAHCVSQWGQDFRPGYLDIARFLETLPRRPVVGAFTATATGEVREDIVRLLGLADPVTVVTGFDRPNLYFGVEEPRDKYAAVTRYLAAHTGASGIVYCLTRKTVEEVCEKLRADGYAATRYHAGLSADERQRNQDAFLYDEARVMVATNAFGMGIDKADVRVVVHYDVPDSPEAYFQEAGRAGRDGKRAYAVLLSSRAALGGLQKRIDDAFPPKDYILRVYEALANYYQLGEGEGQGRAFEFNLKLFARNFKLNEARVMSAISILEVAGFLGYTTDINSRSRVMFTVLRDRLYEFETGDPLLERLMVLLMRNYAGIFVQDAYVDEGFLADQLDVTRKVLYDAFISLAKRKIIRYVPGDVKPYIVYYQPRLPLSYITLGREAYENRKELFVTKIGAMARYIRDDETCRQLLLMEYFGQKEEKPCGICDVCIGKKKRLHREERKSLEEQILQVLAKQNTNIRELVRQLGEDEEVVIGQVRKLLDEGKIQYVSTLELGITRKS